ncbi:MAG: bifunctional riboflavin kinase/FAD synthetase [Gammaproteobacteria bacterium]
MELIRGLTNLKPAHHGCVLAIGNFDGVHRGHQVIIEQLHRLAHSLDLPASLLTFEPLPREVLDPANAPARLTRLREKLIALRDSGLERVLCVHFDHAFSRLSPEQFIETLLVQRLGVRALVVGDDFRFGHRGSGDISLLRTAGERYGYQVIDCARFELHGRRVSSSWVREALAQGNLALSTELLGRPYCIHGRVAHGDQLGRTISFPTANIRLLRDKAPVSGVFAVRLHGLATPALPGVANVGKRPTVNGVDSRLEVHLFDFEADIYGRQVAVELVRKIRDEQKFASLDALKAQIQYDAEQARHILQQPAETGSGVQQQEAGSC